MTNCVQLLQHVDLLHADGGLGFQKEFDYIQAATVEKKGSYDDGGDGDGGGGDCGDGGDCGVGGGGDDDGDVGECGDGDGDGDGHLVAVNACCSSSTIRQE